MESAETRLAPIPVSTARRQDHLGLPAGDPATRAVNVTVLREGAPQCEQPEGPRACRPVHSPRDREGTGTRSATHLTAVRSHVSCGRCVYCVMRMKEPLDQAVRRHGKTVLRVCRAVLGHGADADDAWSETFLAALRAWPDLPDNANVEAWLVRVAHRKSIDITRARARHAIPTGEPPERHSALGTPGGDHRDVWRAVASLPERQRLAIAYHYLGGLPHAATAELIGGTPDAVRRAAADGIKSLRRIYRADEHPKGAPR